MIEKKPSKEVSLCFGKNTSISLQCKIICSGEIFSPHIHSKTNWTDQFYICNICKTKQIQDRRIFSEAHTSKRLLVVNGLKIFTQWVTHLWAICSKHIICYIYHKKHVKTARLILGEWGHSGRIKKHELFFWSCLFLPVSRWVISWAGNQN